MHEKCRLPDFLYPNVCGKAANGMLCVFGILLAL